MTDTTSGPPLVHPNWPAPQPPLVILRQKLEDRRNELKHALPSDIDPDHFIRALTTSAQINPDLQACSWASLWLAAMKACRDGLLPDGVEGAIVPYKTQAQWLPMYRGLLKKFRQSGQCKWIGADVVRQGETFEHYVDEQGEHFKHVPGDIDTRPIVKVYAAALTRDGAFYVAVMPMAEIEKIKKMSRASRDDAPWRMWESEMQKKTALRRLSKLLPAGREIIGEDDDGLANVPSIEAPLAPMPLPPRPVSAADQLQTFASSAPERGEEQDGGGEPEAPPTGEPAVDPIMIAHKRGQQARAAGHNRKAMPGEYRALDRIREAQAWTAGFDDQSIPEGTD